MGAEQGGYAQTFGPMQKTGDRLKKRKVRFRRAELLETAAAGNDKAGNLRTDPAQKLGSEGRFAHAGFGRNEGHAPSPRKRAVQQLLEARHLGLAPDKFSA